MINITKPDMPQQASTHDVYLDSNGKVTTDASKAAFQVAFKGAVISPNARKRYGLNEDGSVVGSAPAPAPAKPAAPKPAPGHVKK